MYGIIVSQKYKDAIRDVAGKNEIWYEKYGSFTPEEFVHHCQSVANANVQYLFVDTDCTEEAALIKGIRQFRLKRDSRIFLLASGRKPGDLLINNLLKLQIYDIIVPEFEDEDGNEPDDEHEEGQQFSISFYIKQQMAQPYRYSNAARWDVQNEDHIFNKPVKQAKVRDKKEQQSSHLPDPSLMEHMELLTMDFPQNRDPIEEKIIGTVIIGVAGSTRRSGCSYAALGIAAYLTSQKKKVALAEMKGQSPSSLREYDSPEKIKNGFIINGIHAYPEAEGHTLTSIMLNDFEYVVVDFGQLLQFEDSDEIKTFNFQDFARCQLHLITLGSSIGDNKAAFKTLDYLFTKEWNRPLSFLANYTNSKSFSDISNALTREERTKLNVQFYPLPIRSDPFEQSDNDWSEILSAVLAKKKKKRLFW